MTYEEALSEGLITTEDIYKMRDFFSMTNLDRYIMGKTVSSLSDGPGTVIGIDTELSAVNIDFDGTVHTLLFPEGFIKSVKFDNPVVQKYIDARIAAYEVALEWGAAFDEPNCLYSLYIFRLAQGKEDEASSCLCRAAMEGHEYAQNYILGHCSRRIEDGLTVDAEAIEFAVDLYKKRTNDGDVWGPIMLADYYYVTQNYKTAEEYYKISAENNQLEHELRGEQAARLARMYLTGMRSPSYDQGIFRNYQLAKKYFDIAYKCEYSCEADRAFVDRVLGIEIRQNAMKQMAEKILTANYSPKEKYQYILSDLRSEFGGLWEALPKASQIDLVSGCMVYCDLYTLGDTICEEIDFSASIIPIVKAAEVVFRKYLCHDYLEYLRKSNIPPTAFPSSYPLLQYDKQTRTYQFQDMNSVIFTLGSIKHLIIDARKREVYPEFVSYAYEIMGASMGSRRELKEYFTRLSQVMTQFTFDIRNPAAHSSIMPLWQAEICGNEIILVKKILKDFIGKIN